MRWLLLPLALLGALLGGLFSRRLQRSAAEVARYLRGFIEGTGGEYDWDDFESIPIADPVLDGIRRRAAEAGPPKPDMVELRRLLAEAEMLAAEEASVG